MCYIKYSVLLMLLPLIKSIFHMCRLSWNTYIRVLALFLWGNRAISLNNNRTIHECFEIWNLFKLLNRISHSFALLTRKISSWSFEIYFTLPHIHALFSIHTLFLLIMLLSSIFQLNFLTKTKMTNCLKLKTKQTATTTSLFYTDVTETI